MAGTRDEHLHLSVLTGLVPKALATARYLWFSSPRSFTTRSACMSGASAAVLVLTLGTVLTPTRPSVQAQGHLGSSGASCYPCQVNGPSVPPLPGYPLLLTAPSVRSAVLPGLRARDHGNHAFISGIPRASLWTQNTSPSLAQYMP